MIIAKEAIDRRPPGLYYLIYWKKKTHAEDTWESVKRVFHLRQLLKKNHTKNPKKPITTSLPIDKGAPPSLMAICSRAKVAPYILTLTCSLTCKYLLTHNRSLMRVPTISGLNQHLVSQLRRTKRCRNSTSRP